MFPCAYFSDDSTIEAPGGAFGHARLRVLARTSRVGAAEHAEPSVTVDSATSAVVAELPASAFRNANGSPRLRDDQYHFVRQRIVPLLERWSRDPRLAIDPAYVTALILKESGGDSLAVSGAPALGIAQLTISADSDMRLMVTEYHFQWMAPEVDRWPRSAPVHASTATAPLIDSLLASGAVNARNEYLFDPATSARAAVFWIRLLENKWTTDFWPGGYGPSARARLNGGKPLTHHQMFDLVTVSYNRGYIEVKSARRQVRPGLDGASRGAHRRQSRSGRLSRARARVRGAAARRASRERRRDEAVQLFRGTSRITSAGPEPVARCDHTKKNRKSRSPGVCAHS